MSKNLQKNQLFKTKRVKPTEFQEDSKKGRHRVDEKEPLDATLPSTVSVSALGSLPFVYRHTRTCSQASLAVDSSPRPLTQALAPLPQCLPPFPPTLTEERRPRRARGRPTAGHANVQAPRAWRVWPTMKTLAWGGHRGRWTGERGKRQDIGEREHQIENTTFSGDVS